MFKRFISVILIIMIMFLFTSCNKANDDNAMIQIWSYDFENASAYSDGISTILSNAKFFCDKNEIPLEIVRYNEKTISYNDYVLKRNAAAAGGNVIIIEDARYIGDLSKQHADYTKLENYDLLLDVYKNRYCIPLGIGHSVTYKYNDAINYYDINTDNPLITYDEYLEIKQQMKDKGAEFKLNYWEFQQLVDYFLIKNNIKYLNAESEIFKDNNNLKESLKKAIIELCDDLKTYNNNVLNPDIKITNSNNNTLNKNDFTIYDENSDLILCDFPGSYLVTYYGSYLYDSILEKTFVMSPDVFVSPCFFMYKKITNNKIYDLANYIVSENTYLGLVGVSNMAYYYSPVFNGEKTRKIFELDDNWQYTGMHKTRAEQGNSLDTRIYNLINEIYYMQVNNIENSNILSNYYFTNTEYSDKIYNFVADTVINLSNKNYDYKNEEVNKAIDEEIDKFITNFNIHYN